VQEATGSLLTSWQNFYVIIGSAAAALTGLMFIVITLISGNREAKSSESLAAFGTPNVVHFCSSLLIAAIICAPWQLLWNASLLLVLCGMGGVGYICIVIRRARRQASYKMVMEDLLWHIVFPFISYISLVVAGVVLIGNPVPALFVIGGATILLLFIGIHNAWDTVTYVTFTNLERQDKGQS
jgi:hypothetical protein